MLKTKPSSLYRVDEDEVSVGDDGKGTAPTEAQMRLLIAQTLSMDFVYNAPVVVLKFDVAENGNITGVFKDAARPRVFSFTLDGESVAYKPYKPGKMDSLESEEDVQEWEAFSAGYGFRVDAGVGGKKKPQCVKPTAYNCGKACINIKNNCKSNPDDAQSKDRLEKLKAAGIDYAKEAKKSNPKSTTKTKKEVEKPPEIDKIPETIKEIPPSKKGKESDFEEGKKAAKIAVKSEDQTETLKEPENEPKPLNLVGKGDHESVPGDAYGYFEAMKASGNPISYDDAIKITGAVKEWTEDASYIRESQKAGKYSLVADRITDYVKSSTPFKGEIYRGISFGSTDEALSWAKGDKDGILDNQNAHASWTSNWDKARGFAGNNSVNDFTSQPVIIKTNNKSGASIKNLSNIGAEDEVVVAKDTRHRVKKVVYEDGVLIVETEEVSPGKEKKTPEPSPEITKTQKESEKKATEATSKAKTENPPVSTPELKPEPQTVAPKAKKQQSTKLVGNGTHKGVPKNAQEYQKAIAKAGGEITPEEAQRVVQSISGWTDTSHLVRNDQKAGKFNQQGEDIASFVKNSTPYKGEIYRGINLSSREEALKWLKGDKDGILDNQNAHASWSSKKEIAERFSAHSHGQYGKGSQPVIIEAVNKSGASIRNLANPRFKDQDEVVVLKDTRHKIKSFTERGGVIYAQVEEVESSDGIEQEKTPKQPEEKPKNLNLVGKGDHESMPSTPDEYREALEKAGVNISKKEAAATTTAIYKWTRDSSDIRVDQKAGEENEDANRISNYVRNSTPYKGEVYRGIHFATKEEALNWANGDKDGVLDNQGAHASWSSSLETAEYFSDDFDDFDIYEPRYPVVIKAINKSGASIRNLSNIKEEDEVMVLKDTRHRVKSVKKENGRIIVEAEEV